MAKHNRTRARLLIAMQLFDVAHRGQNTDLGDFTEKEGWPNNRYTGLIFHDNRYYPPKIIVSLAIPSYDRQVEQTETAIRILESQDFEIKHFGERGKIPKKCCWAGFSDSRRFGRSLPLNGDEFWELLLERVHSEFEAEFQHNESERKIGGIADEGNTIIVFRRSNENVDEWSETPSKINREQTINGYEELLELTGECSSEIFSSEKIHNEAIVYLCRDLLEWGDEDIIRIKSVEPISSVWTGFTQETFDIYEQLLKTPEKYNDVYKPLFNEHVVTPLIELFHALAQTARELQLPFAPFIPKRGKSLSKLNVSGNYGKKFWACFHLTTGEKKTEAPQFFLTIRPSHIQFGFYRNLIANYSEETHTLVEHLGASPEFRPILDTLSKQLDLAIDAEDASETGEVTKLSIDDWIASFMDPKVEPLIRWRMEPSEVVAKGASLLADVENTLRQLAPLYTLMSNPQENEISMQANKQFSKHESQIFDLIKRRRCIILEGVPGTGKTHVFKSIRKEKFFISMRFLTFHPSSDYSSFIGGIRPGEKDNTLIFNATKGHLLNILEEANNGPALLWIDELNRANVPRVFGDLISLIGNEHPPPLQILNAGLKDNKIELTPKQVKNLHIVATMNTSDRSVTPLDAALRRRFSFRRLEPMTKEELIKANDLFSDSEVEKHLDCFLRLNEVIQRSMGEDAILGHSYLFDMLDEKAPKQSNEIEMIWKFSILPNIIDNLMLTQNFDILNEINGALEAFGIPFKLEPWGHGLGKIILVGGAKND